MPDPQTVRQVVYRWLVKADHDLDAATRLLQSGEGWPSDAVCFHAQQCVEKHLKAWLTLRGIEFKRTHDIKTLLALIPPRARPRLTAEEQAALTTYAVVTRYPDESDDEEDIDSEARNAVRIARRVRNHIRRTLPKDCIPKA